MPESQRTILAVVQTFRNDGEDVSVVRCSDGTCGIAQNGELIQTLGWGTNQIDQCIAFAERFAHTTGSEAQLN